MAHITLLHTTSDHADFNALVMKLNADLTMRYGDVQKQYDQYNKVEAIPTAIVVYFDNQPAGCACFKPYDAHSVEIKRMFVDPVFRGKGLSKRMLQELERWAIEKGYTNSVLETGDQQPEAIALYTAQGYEQIPNYEPYIAMPASICFGKVLSLQDEP